MKSKLNIPVWASLCMCFLLTAPLRGQEEKNMSLSLEPMSLLGGSIPVTFSVKLADWFSLGLSGYDKLFSLSKENIQGVGGGLSGKFHLSSKAFSDGWYIKPEVMAGWWVFQEPNKTSGYGLEPRLVAGYDWIWHPGFTLGIGLGIKHVYFSGNQEKIKNVEAGFGFHNFFPNADLSVGWAF